jgi:uncharacterized protein YndB with AHSA1/START domain
MLIAMLAIAAAQTAPPVPPRPFQGMEFLVGHCWQGTFSDGKTDTHCFEPVYGGRFVRDRHEVTGGYAGETLYAWEPAQNRASYTYWASSGGISRGTMRNDNGTLVFDDQVHRINGREVRISTTWKQLDATSYEARSTAGSDPTGSRVVRYTRVDAAPVTVEEAAGPGGTRTLTHELFVPAPPADVYAAFATPEGWRTWAVPHAWAVAGDPDLLETSYTAGAVAGDPRHIRQHFLLRVPNRMIAWRTVRTPPGVPHSAEFKQVTSLVELEPVGSGTRVRLSGIGYPAGAAGDQLLGFFREGNRTSLEQLRTRFTSGPIDWAARQRAAAKR